jgi:hypothetical protein
MRQPIIDPDKVNAWTASMRDAFSGGPGDIGMWLLVGITVAVLALVLLAAWQANRRIPDPLDDLQHLIDAKPGPKSLAVPHSVVDVHVGRGARTNHPRDDLARAARRRADFTAR